MVLCDCLQLFLQLQEFVVSTLILYTHYILLLVELCCFFSMQVSSSQGQVYSMYTRSPNFRWIKDFSSIDIFFLITPGNNGHLYVTFPRISCLMALDVYTGNMLWQHNVGPLSSEDFSPAIDSNGELQFLLRKLL